MDKIIYEVNMTLNASAELAFLKWLKPHINEMEQVPGLKPEPKVFSEAIEESAQDQRTRMTVCYEFDTFLDYQNYLQNQAKEMRAKLPPELKDSVEYNRRVLVPYDLP